MVSIGSTAPFPTGDTSPSRCWCKVGSAEVACPVRGNEAAPYHPPLPTDPSEQTWLPLTAAKRDGKNSVLAGICPVQEISDEKKTSGPWSFRVRKRWRPRQSRPPKLPVFRQVGSRVQTSFFIYGLCSCSASVSFQMQAPICVICLRSKEKMHENVLGRLGYRQTCHL